jgi:Flp pilus assembly protein TadG
MRRKPVQPNPKERGVVLLMTSVLLMFLVIPSVGLAIDAGIAFTIKAKLQASSDAAALAAARSLSRGLNLTAQQSSATTTASRFFNANIQNGWMGLSNPTINVTFPTAPPKTTIVNVATGVDVPTYFMRVAGFTSMHVNGAGAATRRDVNVELVVDRSGSLSTACAALRTAGNTFVQSFVDGRDRLGLITFGTTYHSDFDPAMDFQSRATPNDMVTMVNNIGCVGGTNSAAAYWLAWQKLLAINEPGTLNVIVFFTDGYPNTVTMNNLQVKTGALGTSTCVDKSDRTGVIEPAGAQVWGVALDVETGPPPAPNPDWRPIANKNGCAFASNLANLTSDIYSLTKPLDTDQHDVNNISLLGWQPVTRTGGRIMFNVTNVTNAGVNALDNAAQQVRTLSAANNLSVVTYAIGFNTDYPDLMKRIANTTDSMIYDSTRPTGLYVYASDSSQLSAAFAKIASDILRISK